VYADPQRVKATRGVGLNRSEFAPA
jgi:hypothetical protein